MRTDETTGMRPPGRLLRRMGRLSALLLMMAGVLWLMGPVPYPGGVLSVGTALRILIREILTSLAAGFLPLPAGVLWQAVRALMAVEIRGLAFLPLWMVALSWVLGILLGFPS